MLRLDPCRTLEAMGGRSRKLTGAFYVGNGWVAGGCWDDY